MEVNPFVVVVDISRYRFNGNLFGNYKHIVRVDMEAHQPPVRDVLRRTSNSDWTTCLLSFKNGRPAIAYPSRLKTGPTFLSLHFSQHNELGPVGADPQSQVPLGCYCLLFNCFHQVDTASEMINVIRRVW